MTDTAMTDTDVTDTTLLLLHGLGANAGVWAETRAALAWPGRVIAPDLPGHGTANATGDYTVGALAAAVASLTDDAEEVIAVGHSLGGGVALCLASGFFRPTVVAAVGIGIKVAWSDADVAAMAKVAAREAQVFASRDEAVERFLRQAGLTGVADATHAAVATGVIEVATGWRVAQDPRTFGQRALDMRGLVTAAKCPVVLGAGEHDPMVTEADLAHFVDDPRIAPTRGHNVQVEDPRWVCELIEHARQKVAR